MHRLAPTDKSTTAFFQVFDVISQRWEKAGLSGLIFHDDNARSYGIWVAAEFLTENSLEAYSSNLNPCNFYLFPKLKNQLQRIRFNNDDEMLGALTNVIGSLTEEDFQKRFNDWFSRMHKCIDTGGEYFETLGSRCIL